MWLGFAINYVTQIVYLSIVRYMEKSYVDQSAECVHGKRILRIYMSLSLCVL